MKELLLGVLISTTNLNYSGTYNLDMNINGQSFKDVLILKGRYYASWSGHYIVDGSFIAPGAFTSPFRGRFSEGELRGDFVAQEDGRETKYDLLGFISSNCEIEGQLLVSGEVFGEFSGVKENVDGPCY